MLFPTLALSYTTAIRILGKGIGSICMLYLYLPKLINMLKGALLFVKYYNRLGLDSIVKELKDFTVFFKSAATIAWRFLQ